MSDVLPHKKGIDRPGKLREYRQSVEQLDFGRGAQPVQVRLANTVKGKGTCLGCHDVPCIMLGAPDTLLPEVLRDFPGDPAREVCPTRAISWNDLREAVSIDADHCIGCGLCAARCPYGAISLTVAGKAVVETADPDNLTILCPNDSNSSKHPKPHRVGQFGTLLSPALQQMPQSVGELTDLQGSQFVRNLLIQCGIKCRTRRRGDTNIRMDGVLGLANNRVGVLEIELSYAAILESPRALLEDVAVLHARYGLQVDQIDPVSLVLALPNARSEYFQVIADIQKILNLQCRTVSIGCLLMVLWQFQTIKGFPGDLFMTAPGDTDLWPPMKRFISGLIPDQPYAGAYRPSK